jgi:iron complex outermembrane receptor protein
VDSVEGAARHTQRLTEAPASVSVVTANDIETFGWRTLADVLRSVRGFHVTYDRNYSYVGVRAFGRPTDYNNRVLVLLNGHRSTTAFTTAHSSAASFRSIWRWSIASRSCAARARRSTARAPSSPSSTSSPSAARTSAPATCSFEAGSLDTYKVRASHGWSDDAAAICCCR